MAEWPSDYPPNLAPFPLGALLPKDNEGVEEGPTPSITALKEITEQLREIKYQVGETREDFARDHQILIEQVTALTGRVKDLGDLSEGILERVAPIYREWGEQQMIQEEKRHRRATVGRTTKQFLAIAGVLAVIWFAFYGFFTAADGIWP